MFAKSDLKVIVMLSGVHHDLCEAQLPQSYLSLCLTEHIIWYSEINIYFSRCDLTRK